MRGPWRALPVEFPDAAYHVTSGGVERRAIVRGERDRGLGEVATHGDWRLCAFALVDNDFYPQIVPVAERHPAANGRAKRGVDLPLASSVDRGAARRYAGAAFRNRS